MTVEELIKLGKIQVRNNPDLMNAYKELFFEKFGRHPNCVPCTFNSDWNRLTGTAPQPQQNYIMRNTTFQLIDNSTIYSYDSEDRKAGRKIRHRTYGNTMTEDFAIAYLTNGSKDEIEKRKLHFKVLPSFLTQKTEEPEVPAKHAKKAANGKK